jgi:N-acetylneuraminate synthase
VAEHLIAGRLIGPGESPYVIAEISANHGGSKAAALELVHAAKAAGADAVKLQHYTPETITVRSDHPDFRVQGGTLWDGRQLADLYAEAMTPWDWTADLVALADELGITWFSSPFDRTAVDFLDELDVPAFKIASFEIIDLPLVRYAASKGRPLVISTGMATIDEIATATAAARDAGAASVSLLRCNSGYPARPAEMDLRAIPVMAELWGLPVGLSDHTIGATAAVTAVGLGACMIEKHITHRRADGGPDAAFSAEPDELAALVAAVREAHSMLGEVRFGPSERERASIAFRRSLRAVRPIAAGELLSEANVASVRPAGGLAPDLLDVVIGMTATRELAPGDPLTWDHLRARV